MAGTKTINIVYNVDTKSIQVARGQVDAAKKATDDLSQSAQKLGAEGSAGAQKFANSIAGIKAQLEQQKNLIELTNQSDKALLDQRIAKYNELQKQLNQYQSKLKDVNKEQTNVAQNLNNLYGAVKLAFTAGLIKEAISAQLEMAKLAGQVQGVTAAFSRLPNSTLLMDQLRKSTHGAVDDITLMQTALRANNFRIPLQQLGTLLEFAAVKAQQTGQEVNHLVEYLVSGIGYKSIKRLDDLGFTANRMKEALGGVSLQAASTGQIMDAVAKLMNEDLSQTGGYLETSATKVQQLEVALKELKITVSQAFASSSVVDFFKTIVQGTDAMFKSRKQLNDELNKNEAIGRAQGFLSVGTPTVESIDREITAIQKEMQSRGALKATIREQFQALVDLHSIAYQGEIDKLKERYKWLGDQNVIDQTQIKILKEKQSQLKSITKDEAEELGLIPQIEAKIEALDNAMKKAFSEDQVQRIAGHKKELEDYLQKLTTVISNPTENKSVVNDINAQIRKQIRETNADLFKDTAKDNKRFNDELLKDQKDDWKKFIAGLKLFHKEDEDERRRHEQYVEQLTKFAATRLYQATLKILNIMADQNVQNLDSQINSTRDYYDNQISLAGDNTKAKEKLQKQENEQLKKLDTQRIDEQKKADRRKILIANVAAVAETWAKYGFPDGWPFAAVMAGIGIAEIAAVNKYAKGVIDLKGPGTGTSDSIPSMLSRGESVMTAQETFESKHILTQIRAKKLNDKILDKLMIQPVQMNTRADNKDVVEAIKGQKQPDFVKIGGMLYEARNEGKNMRRIIRSKSFSR